MDFSFSEEQVSIRDLAKQIFRDNCTDEKNAEFSKSDDTYNQKVWSLLAESGLTGVAVPESCGGSGFGFIEICQILEEQGRHVATVPLTSSLVLGGLPIAKFGSVVQQEKSLSLLATGQIVLSAAIAELGMPAPMCAVTKATKEGSSWILNGNKQAVPYAAEAQYILIPAQTNENKTVVFMVDTKTSGISIEPQFGTNWEPMGDISLNGVKLSDVDILGSVDSGDEIINYIQNHAHIACCAVAVGVTEEALRRTAEYTSERKQFGMPIAGFQNTNMRCADAYIDIEAMRSTYWQAMWLLSESREADAEVRSAKWWACTGSHRVTHTAQHLHGGIGSDTDYPLHRYYLWGKQMELIFGGGTLQLAELGKLLADKERNINVL